MKKHPRDTYITVYGRKPVLEILQNNQLNIKKMFLDKKAKGQIIKDILKVCTKRDVEIERTTADQVSRISKHPKQDQGIAIDVVAPQMESALSFLSNKTQKTTYLLALDGVTTPGNVGLTIRSCTGLGVDGIILPRKGTAKLSPLVIKASAGVVFKSRILKCETLAEILPQAKQAGYTVYGLAGEQGTNLYEADLAEKAIFILGNETEGVSSHVRKYIDHYLTIPMRNQVESLNVACAGTVVASELLRRRILLES